MKYLITLLIAFAALSCGSDDESTTDSNGNSFVITVDEITVSSAKISWTIPSASNGLSLRYKVLLNGSIKIENTTSRSYEFTGLASETDYNITVFALDSEGNETFAEGSFITERSEIGGDIVLNTQEQVDDFSYIAVSSLTIGGADITDISNLQVLQAVYRNLNIVSTGLTNLNGLQNVVSEEGDQNLKLSISSNPALQNIADVSNFAVNAQEIYLLNNTSLNDLSGFTIDPFGRHLEIKNIPATDFSNFSNYVDTRVLILDNIAPTAVQGFSNLFRGLFITLKNIDIQDLTAFTALTDGGKITLEDMTQLVSLNGMDNNVGFTSLNIIGNTNLQDISALNFTNGNPSFGFEDSPINNLSILSDILDAENISVRSCPNITNLSGLSSLRNISTIAIRSCSSLTSLQGTSLAASGIATETYVRITGNTLLSDFCPLQPYLSAGGLRVVDNVVFYEVSNNAYNPTSTQIQTPEGCSQ